jgi:hypothetical protein
VLVLEVACQINSSMHVIHSIFLLSSLIFFIFNCFSYLKYFVQIYNIISCVGILSNNKRNHNKVYNNFLKKLNKMNV